MFKNIQYCADFFRHLDVSPIGVVLLVETSDHRTNAVLTLTKVVMCCELV